MRAAVVLVVGLVLVLVLGACGGPRIDHPYGVHRPTGWPHERWDHTVHPGVDYDRDDGDLVIAAASGTVLSVGLCIVIDHSLPDRPLFSASCFDGRVFVTDGNPVKRGQVIGVVHTRDDAAFSAPLHFQLSTVREFDTSENVDDLRARSIRRG